MANGKWAEREREKSRPPLESNEVAAAAAHLFSLPAALFV